MLPKAAPKKNSPSFFSYQDMGSRGTFMLCTTSSRYMRIDAAERLSGERCSPPIDSTSVNRSVSELSVIFPIVLKSAAVTKK